MRHLTYLLVLAGCLVSALWLEPVLKVNVLGRGRRLLLTLLPVVIVFVLWDLAAIAAGHWTFDPAQTTGIVLPGGLPLDEVLFFVVVPVCAILGFEAVRAVLRLRAGDELATDAQSADLAGHDLAGHDLAGHDLAGHDLGGHDLAGHDLGGHDLAGHGLGGDE